MEAEYGAMSQACKTLFPIVDMVQELGETFCLDVDDETKSFVKIRKDNVSTHITLGQLEPSLEITSLPGNHSNSR